MRACAPIGVFDSGSGGLTVARQLHKILPGENIIYVGDMKRMPYGPRKPEEIIKFMDQFLHFFASKNVKMAVFACNTMTSWGYEKAVGRTIFPLVPMSTAVSEAAAVSPHKKIGVIATEATVKKGFHADMAAKIDKNIEVYAVACPDFVTLIESGHIEDAVLENAARSYMLKFKEKSIESLILGCTHYPIISDILKKYLDTDVSLINPALSTVKKTEQILRDGQMLNSARTEGKMEFFFSSAPEHAAHMVKIVMGLENPFINNIDLSEFN
ncbi:glutamate racemase [Pectinatus haikarae]|uniref:Glutamate racemase n=1 Tax=Pectinatus haikarae TaxID=349096 RepID=A0ABT9Y9D3_9FIRM|nr:glutamate racemase [Pectinatus haikarae]MDQ0204441.1 glutamate racemase [Pectinatus haikarae]